MQDFQENLTKLIKDPISNNKANQLSNYNNTNQSNKIIKAEPVIQKALMSSCPVLEVSILSEIPTSSQLIQTLKNLQKITQINVDSPDFKSSLQNFSEEHMILYRSHTTQEGSPYYVCFLEDQRDGEGYIHQLTGEVLRVEPLEGLVLERKQNQKAKLDQTSLKLIKYFYDRLNAYMDQYFSGSYAATCHFKTDSGAVQQIIIGITNKNSSPTNFSAGQWTSFWRFSSTQCTAKITARNHFHQAGNIVFQRPKSIHKTFLAQQTLSLNSLTEQTLDRILSIIQNEETNYQKELQKIYAQQLSQSLKKLRRISPLTQTKMIWNVNAVLLSQGLNQKLPEFA